MRKILITLTVIILLFIGCAPQIGVDINKEFSPEIEVKTGKKFPEIEVQDLAKEIKINDQTYSVKTKDGKSAIQISRKHLDILKEEGATIKGKEDWKVSYDESKQLINIVPSTDRNRIQLLKQNPENKSEYINFDSLDVNAINVEYKSKDLPQERLNFITEESEKYLILDIPSWSFIADEDYQINISRKFYETYQQKLTDIENKIKLDLAQSEFTVDFRNKEKSVYMPEEVYIINATGEKKTYLTTQMEGGIELYNMDFPVVLTGDSYKWQLFNSKGEKVDSLVFSEPGQYRVEYIEKERELPLVFYDISTDYIKPELFENWVLNKSEKIDNIFLFVSNGYESFSNWGAEDKEEILNRIYRISPRDGNILELIERFAVQRDRKNILGKYLENPAQYGKKLEPRYYVFMSNDNIKRLSTAVDLFKDKLEEIDIPLDQLTLCVGQEVVNSNFVDKLKKMDVEIEEF